MRLRKAQLSGKAVYLPVIGGGIMRYAVISKGHSVVFAALKGLFYPVKALVRLSSLNQRLKLLIKPLIFRQGLISKLLIQPLYHAFAVIIQPARLR